MRYIVTVHAEGNAPETYEVEGETRGKAQSAAMIHYRQPLRGNAVRYDTREVGDESDAWDAGYLAGYDGQTHDSASELDPFTRGWDAGERDRLAEEADDEGVSVCSVCLGDGCQSCGWTGRGDTHEAGCDCILCAEGGPA